MQVLTIFSSNYDPTSDYCTKLTYTYNDDHTIGSAYVPSRGIHIQGPGSQSLGVKHDSCVNPDALQSGIFRIICTTHLTLSPKHGKEFANQIALEGVTVGSENGCNSYERDVKSHNITSVVCLSEEQTSIEDSNNHRKRTNLDNIMPTMIDFNREDTTNKFKYKLEINNRHKKQKEKNPIPSIIHYKTTDSIADAIFSHASDDEPFHHCTNVVDVYPNIPKNLWCKYNIPSVTIRFKFNDRINQLTTGSALLCLLRNGYKVFVRRSDNKLYPCLYDVRNQENNNQTYLLETMVIENRR
jgi:hypothetical protein